MEIESANGNWKCKWKLKVQMGIESAKECLSGNVKFKCKCKYKVQSKV
jgi:hypothetical protein